MAVSSTVIPETEIKSEALTDLMDMQYKRAYIKLFGKKKYNDKFHEKPDTLLMKGWYFLLEIWMDWDDGNLIVSDFWELPRFEIWNHGLEISEAKTPWTGFWTKIYTFRILKKISKSTKARKFIPQRNLKPTVTTNFFFIYSFISFFR